MYIVKNEESNRPYFRACIALVWLMVIYSSVIQDRYFKIPNGMLIMGISILGTYVLAFGNRPFEVQNMLEKENMFMIFFLAYMFVIGTLVSPARGDHISQWVTCLEYLFIQIVISTIIKENGTDTFSTLLLFEALILAAILFFSPVLHVGSRYSISVETNPNGLAMQFAAGIWAIVYRYQKKKSSLLVSAALIVLFGYSIMLTGSRKAFIAASIIVILWLILCFLPGLKRKGSYLGLLSFIGIAVLTSIIGIVFLKYYTGSNIAERMGNLQYEATEGKRFDLYRAGFEMFKSSPLFGIGFQGFAYNFESYYNINNYYSHATLIEIPVSGGIIGSLLYFSAYYISIRKVLFLFWRTKEKDILFPEHERVKMLMVLWAVMLFYTTCIIHPYQFSSYILFGIIFGETGYIECRLEEGKKAICENQTGSRYIRND